MEWLRRLPHAVDALMREWSLALGAPFMDDGGSCAWVSRVSLPDGTAAVLKLGMPHMEAEHEIAGLRFWSGRPMVRLLDANEQLNAMLLEACIPGTPLSDAAPRVQDVVIGGVLRELRLRPPPTETSIRPLSAMLDQWASETLADESSWPDHGVVSAGLELFRELPRTAPEEVLLFTDLHAGNVLRAERAAWLAIDPKPFVGDPAYDATQHLFNCADRMRADPMRTIAEVADEAGLSRERVRLWTFARAAAEPRSNWRDETWIWIARRIG